MIRIDEMQIDGALVCCCHHLGSAIRNTGEDGIEELVVNDFDTTAAQLGREAGCMRSHAPRDPGQASAPWYDAYIAASTARSTCAVQMLLVAFSRRMCCSRVCSASR